MSWIAAGARDAAERNPITARDPEMVWATESSIKTLFRKAIVIADVRSRRSVYSISLNCRTRLSLAGKRASYGVRIRNAHTPPELNYRQPGPHLRQEGRNRRTIMSLLRILVAVAVLTATTGTVAFARSSHEQPPVGHAQFGHGQSEFYRAESTAHPWCLHDYLSSNIDCSYASRSQCEGTGSGGIGQCSIN